MTDARLPGRWLTDPNLEALSDRLWRVHTGALMWSAEQGTDGLIPRRTLRLLHPDAATSADASTLVSAGLWAVEGDAFRVLDWENSQSLDADVKRRRELDRERKRRQRSKANVTRDSMQDESRDVRRESSRRGESEDSSSRVSIPETRDARDDEIVEAEIVDDDYFDTAWRSWPKRERRVEAETAFEDAAKRHPRGPQGLADDIAAHGAAYVRGGWATPEAMRYVPGLVGWLTSSRWVDDLPTPRRERKTQSERNADVFAKFLADEGEAS